MPYYHLRYNVYPKDVGPVEKEEWVEFPEHHDEITVRRDLMAAHNSDVSIIISREVSNEEYKCRHPSA